MRLLPEGSLLLSGMYFKMVFEDKQTCTYYRLDTKFASEFFSADTGDNKEISTPWTLGGHECPLFCCS